MVAIASQGGGGGGGGACSIMNPAAVAVVPFSLSLTKETQFITCIVLLPSGEVILDFGVADTNLKLVSYVFTR